MEGYSVFIAGETIDLCVPSKLAIERDGWADWFNDAENTRYLDQGIFPMFEEDQRAFLESLRSHARLALLIRPKGSERAVGTISLSSIKWEARSAQVAIVLDRRAQIAALMEHRDKAGGNLHALEALSRITTHGFETMGLDRIWAGQAYPALKKWGIQMELLGYRAEGVLRESSVKGRSVQDGVMMSCLYRHYRRLCDQRGGQLWAGESAMRELRDKLPAKGFADILDALIRDAARQYFGD
jgi:RimJ/RimL family protein N-acetyltransferase